MGFPGGAKGLCATVLTAVCVFSSAGLIFGFSSLYPVLYREEVFARFCDHSGYGSGNCSSISSSGAKCCDAQMAAFTAMSTVAFFTADASMAIYGELNDRIGPRPCFAAGTSMVLAGLGMAALSPAHWRQFYPDFVWITSFALMGLGGPGCFLATLSFSERWDGIEPIISATAAAAFDASAFVFFLFNSLYFEMHISFAELCLGWLTVVAIAAVPMYILPQPPPSPPPRGGHRRCANVHSTPTSPLLVPRGRYLLLPSRRELALLRAAASADAAYIASSEDTCPPPPETEPHQSASLDAPLTAAQDSRSSASVVSLICRAHALLHTAF